MLDPALKVVWLLLAVTAVAARGASVEYLMLHGKLRGGIGTWPSTRLKQNAFSDLTVPKSWFWHFYLLAVAVAVALLDAKVDLLGILFLVHAVRRLCEQLLLFPKSKPMSRMHLFAYFLGLGFYPLFGLSVMAGRHTADTVSADTWDLWVVAFWGFCQVVQCLSHKELAELRNGKHYGLPEGPLFRWTWSPHYVAEIGIFTSFAAVSEGEAVKACAVFVFCSLSVNSVNQSSWYKRQISR